ncbi:syntaxin-61 [Entamoeba marina]
MSKPTMSHQQETELDEYMREENDFFIGNEKSRQQQIIEKQDLQLNKLHENVKTVHEIGLVINDEIEQGGMILDQMSDTVEKTDGRIQSTRKKINEVIEKSSNWKIGIVIGVLIIVLLVIIALIVIF